MSNDKKMSAQQQHHITTVQRRTSMPHALEDPEDFTVGQEESEYYEQEHQRNNKKHDPFPAAADSSSVEKAVELEEKFVSKLPRELRNLLAGGIAGMVAKTLVAPIDRIKILYQVSNVPFHLWSMPAVAMTIIRNEGFSALWKGNIATMFRIFPYSGIQFMVFDRIKRFYLGRHQENKTHSDQVIQEAAKSRKAGLTATESLFGGMLAGTTSVIFTYPLDLSRAQLAVLMKHKGGANIGLGGIITQNYHSRGTKGLFRGITPTLLGIMPYAGIAFSLNEQGKRHLQSIKGREVTNMERLQCGALAGLIAQSITYPIEVTRRRMQTIGLVGGDSAVSLLGSTAKPTTVSAAPGIPANMMGTIRFLYHEQGIAGFYKGVTVNWIKGPISFGLSFTTFDTIQHFLETDVERSNRRQLVGH